MFPFSNSEFEYQISKWSSIYEYIEVVDSSCNVCIIYKLSAEEIVKKVSRKEWNNCEYIVINWIQKSYFWRDLFYGVQYHFLAKLITWYILMVIIFYVFILLIFFNLHLWVGWSNLFFNVIDTTCVFQILGKVNLVLASLIEYFFVIVTVPFIIRLENSWMLTFSGEK